MSMRTECLAAAVRLIACCAAAVPAAQADTRSDPPLLRDIAPAPRAIAASYRGERAPVDADAVRNLFERHSWLPPAPPPPPAAPLPAKPPEAPRLPFSYLGVIDGRTLDRQALLSKGDQLFIVKKSDVVEGTYRVEAITEQLIEMTYLPLGLRQNLATGATP